MVDLAVSSRHPSYQIFHDFKTEKAIDMGRKRGNSDVGYFRNNNIYRYDDVMKGK